MINNFDEYCQAFSASGEILERARLIKFLREQMITLRNLEPASDEEKRDFVGLTEIINNKNFFKGDELTRIAATTLDAVRHISKNFREKIVRENILMPAYRAKEIDSTGLNWLSKRSGRTIHEKLSSTNNLLAVRRRMSFDTGENRLYMAFLRQMEEYIEQKSLANSNLLTETEYDFQQSALKILHEEELAEVGRWENTPPNNTLLSDKFYRQIWRGRNDLQKLSEMLKSDNEHIGERLCTAYFLKLLVTLGKNENFPQQPIKYDYENFEVRPLRGNSIFGNSLRITKFETRIQIQREEKIFDVEFEGVTYIFFEGRKEILRAEITAENFEVILNQTAEIIFGATKTLEKNFGEFKLVAAKKNYMDIFATRPLYTDSNGNFKRFKSRIVRQEFFSDGEIFDLSAEFSAALSVENSASKIYSLTSCIQEPKTENEKFNRLLQMIHENFSDSNQQIEQLALPLPDIYNEFQLGAIRRAVRMNYNRIETIPRSLAVLFCEMSRNGCKKFSEGNFALVVDYIEGKISLTLVEAHFDSKIKKALPETHGLTWERHPTFSKICKPEGYANFEDKLSESLFKNFRQASKSSLNKILNVFGVEGLQLEAGNLTLQFNGDFENTWGTITENLTKIFENVKFNATPVIKDYLKQMSEVIGKQKIFTFIISPQLNFVDSKATFLSNPEISLQGMKFYDELLIRTKKYEISTGEKLPPLWTDRLPFLAIKRIYGAFELISRNGNKKILPQFGITQKIPVEETFTLPKNRNEYRFGIILNDSKEISYEAVVRNSAFPLKEDTECELHLTYTYGKDIPYELIFKPLIFKNFHEAKVEWEKAAAPNYKNLPAPKFPVDKENWQTLQHIRTHTGKENNALDWVKNTFRQSVILNLDDKDNCFNDNYNPCIFVRTEIDGAPAVVKILKSQFDGKNPKGIWSVFIEENKSARHEIFLNKKDWRTDKRGNKFCIKEFNGETVAFYEKDFLFKEKPGNNSHVTFEIFNNDRTGKRRVVNSLIDDKNHKFYWATKIIRGATPYNLQNSSVIFPLHKIYFNGHSVKIPDCPEEFKNFIERLAASLPQDTMQALKANNTELAKKLVRIMCIMAEDIGQPLYDILKEIFEKKLQIFDEDLGCALGNYDRSEQQQLLMQIQNSALETIQKISVLNKAAWHSDGFILNVPPIILMPYLQSAIDFLKNRTQKDAPDVLKCLEFILAIFRLRTKGDDAINKNLSLNNGKVRELYETVEDMIDENYQLPPSRIELEIKKSTDYAKKISNLYYALLIYINGGEDDIKISGINDSTDEDF